MCATKALSNLRPLLPAPIAVCPDPARTRTSYSPPRCSANRWAQPIHWSFPFACFLLGNPACMEREM